MATSALAAVAISVATASAGVGPATPAGAAPAKNQASAMTSAIQKVMRQNSIPGAIVGVWQKGAAPYVKAFGVRNKATGQPMAANLHMRIGSETKTFTVTALLQLVDQKKVGLDDPISKYVSGVPDGDAITLRELAEMRSGLMSYTASDTWGQQFVADPERQWTPQELLPYSFSQPLLFVPGTNFNYSNTNTVLLGLVVEKASGQTLSTYITQHILKPEHLGHTVFPDSAAFPSLHAQGYTNQTADGQVANSTGWNPSWGWAAGAMISTLSDLRTWAKDVATGTLLTPATQRQREKFIPVPAMAPATYGLALFDINGWIGHNGSLPGYQSLTVYLPAQQTTMVVLLNTDINPPNQELSTLIGRAITTVITPRHIFYFSSAVQTSPSTTTTSAPSAP